MKTTAVRLHGKNDIRLDQFSLPALQDDEILAKVVTDSLCVSSYKALMRGAAHKRVPSDVAERPIILGHEFCGELVEVGRRWQGEFAQGSKFTVQPALNQEGSFAAPGYSFQYIGGDATYIIIPAVVIEAGCLLPFNGEGFYLGSLSEPVSCVIGGCNVMYHSAAGNYHHTMGLRARGAAAILAGTGPMGLCAIDYLIHKDNPPAFLAVSSRNAQKLRRAEQLYPPHEAMRHGVRIAYLHTPNAEGVADQLRAHLINTEHHNGYDDIFVMAAQTELVEIADRILGHDGCVNFFAGPTDPQFSAPINLYNLHYAATHFVSNSGGNTDDMREALRLISEQRINPAPIITHIGGLNCVVEATRTLPSIPGGKKLIYTHTHLPLTAIADFKQRAHTEGTGTPHGRLFENLAQITSSNSSNWSVEAEQYLLTHAEKIEQ